MTILICGVSGEAYNIANPEATATIAEFAELTAKIGGKSCFFKTPDEKEAAQRTPVSTAVLNSGKLQALGWGGRYNITRGIRHTLTILLEANEKK